MSHIQLNTPGRNRLPDRRASVTFAFECNALAYSATISRYPNGGKPSSPLGAALDLVADMLGGRPMTLTSSSSLVLPFVQKFEAWREAWHRQVLADRQLGHRDKSVAGFLLWYLNRQERACFPSYATIAAGVGITRRDAMRCVARLVACGHLLRQPRERKTNYYSPRVVAPCHQGGGTVPPGGGGKLDTLTSKSRTSDLTLGRALKIQEEDRGSPRKQGSPNSPSGVPSSPGNSRPSAAPGGCSARCGGWSIHYL